MTRRPAEPGDLKPNPELGPKPRKGDVVRSTIEDEELLDPHAAEMTVIRCMGGHAWISWSYGDESAIRHQLKRHVRLYHGGERTVFWLYAAEARMGSVVGGDSK